MQTYFDTSLLLKAYIPEASTPAALEIILAANPPVPFSHILELELRTAIRLKHGRHEITAAAMKSALKAVASDLAAGILVRPAYDLAAVYLRAEKISAMHAAATLARSADILHIAAALESGCTVFASFDERQRRCAALTGLTLAPAR